MAAWIYWYVLSFVLPTQAELSTSFDGTEIRLCFRCFCSKNLFLNSEINTNKTKEQITPSRAYVSKIRRRDIVLDVCKIKRCLFFYFLNILRSIDLSSVKTLYQKHSKVLKIFICLQFNLISLNIKDELFVVNC